MYWNFRVFADLLNKKKQKKKEQIIDEIELVRKAS
jgi:hypothetical protein